MDKRGFHIHPRKIKFSKLFLRKYVGVTIRMLETCESFSFNQHPYLSTTHPNILSNQVASLKAGVW